MMAPHAGLERRVQAALDAAPGRVPVLVGGCGTGRTTLLHSLADRLGRDACQYIDVERSASTPERFFRAVVMSSPFRDSVLGDAERREGTVMMVCVSRPKGARLTLDV